MGKWIDYYCADNNRRLIKLVDKIVLKNFGWLPQKEYDDFYSIAGQVVWNCEQNFDDSKGAKFETHLTNCLQRKFKSRITYMNRKKRHSGIPELSIEKLIDSEGDASGENILIAKPEDELSPETQRYLDSLTKTQRRVAELIMRGYDEKRIKEILAITDERFNILCQRMKDRKKIRVFDGIGGIRE